MNFKNLMPGDASVRKISLTVGFIAIAVTAEWIAAGDDHAVLIAAVVVCLLSAMLLKYVPLAAGGPAFAAMVYATATGIDGANYVFPLLLFGTLGFARFFRLLPGGWSER